MLCVADKTTYINGFGQGQIYYNADRVHDMKLSSGASKHSKNVTISHAIANFNFRFFTRENFII